MPAAAVIRRGQALSGFTGCKGGADGHGKPGVKGRGITPGLHWELSGWSAGGVSGIPGVAVKCVDIRRNTGGEGGLLDGN